MTGSSRGGTLTKCIYSSRRGPSQKREARQFGAILADVKYMHKMSSFQSVLPVL